MYADQVGNHAAAAGQAQWQMYQIGHKRDQKTKLVGVKDFTPPLFGKARLAQFHLEATFGLGAYLVGAAIALQCGAAWNERKEKILNATSTRTSGPLIPAPSEGKKEEFSCYKSHSLSSASDPIVQHISLSPQRRERGLFNRI